MGSTIIASRNRWGRVTELVACGCLDKRGGRKYERGTKSAIECTYAQISLHGQEGQAASCMPHARDAVPWAHAPSADR